MGAEGDADVAKPKNRTKSPSKYYQEALNEVMLSIQPTLNQIQRARHQVIHDYHNRMQTARRVYGAQGNQLSDIGGDYNTQAAPIAGQLTDQLGGLSSLLGSSNGIPAEGEMQAGRNMIGAIGSGTLETLASNQGRNAAFNSSARRQGALESMTARRNYTSDLQNYLDDLHSRNVDTMESVPAQVQSVERSLSNDAFNRRMSLAQLALSRRGLSDQEAATAAAQAAADAQNRYTRHIINQLINGQTPTYDPTTAGNARPPSPWGSEGIDPFAGSGSGGGTGYVPPPAATPSAMGLTGSASVGANPSLSMSAQSFQDWIDYTTNSWGQQFGDAAQQDWNWYKDFSNWLGGLFR